MRKVVIHAAGGYDALRVEAADEPEPGPGEVRIRTAAAGVNYADCVVRLGLYESAKKYVGWPITPGFELAGEVDRVGAGARAFAVGDAVLGVTRFGGYATHVVVPEGQLRHRPARLSVAQAAALPAVTLTAYWALCGLAHVRPGATLLVHSVAGGVGGTLAQMGKALGCRVVGVVGSTHKVDAARERGADAVIDKSREDLWARARAEAPDGYDVVLDANGVETLKQSYAHLAPSGQLVVYGFSTMLPRGRGRVRWGKLALDWARTPRFDPLDLVNRNRSVHGFNLSYMFERLDVFDEAMDQILRWVDEGKLTPPPIASFPLSKVADAHRAIESGTTVGKLVLDTTAE